MPGSFHYIGEAFDFLHQEVPIEEVRTAAGPGFQVLPNKKKGIYHVERDG